MVVLKKSLLEISDKLAFFNALRYVFYSKSVPKDIAEASYFKAVADVILALEACVYGRE